MSLSLSETIRQLLSGDVLSWAKFGVNRAGSIQLSTPGSRRLLHYLLSCDQTKVAEANESLFDGLIMAWENDDFDPASETGAKPIVVEPGTWRLARLEASGFGGLNLFDGPPFVVPFSGENWCLEGQNGSGKTSLASAVIWALTGFRCRDQDGLVKEQGHRAPVCNKSGAKIGDWPPITAYPPTTIELAGPAETWVRLTFHDLEGNTAEAYRRLIAMPSEEPIIEGQVDPQLLAAPQLLEVGLLMPARLARIGFGERSQSIYEAVKLLTGLDQLAAIAEGASNFSHKSKRFMKYAVDKGIQSIETKMDLYLDQAKEEAKKVDFRLNITSEREDEGFAQELRKFSQQGSDQAATHLGTIASDIVDTLDTNKAADRAEIKNAVNLAQGILQESVKGVVAFEAWKALEAAHGDTGFQTMPVELNSSKEILAEAIAWDKRQREDHKLRLKALASRFFEPASHPHDDATCPLCEAKLSGEKRQALAAELKALKRTSAAAERKLADVCTELEKRIREKFPTGVNAHFTSLVSMQPRNAFFEAATQRFANSPPFSTVLTGMASFAFEYAERITAGLPTFTHADGTPQGDMPEAAQALADYIRDAERVVALVAWWNEHRQQFVMAWENLNGQPLEGGDSSADSLMGKLTSLEAALEKAVPLDDLANALNAAADEAENWFSIHEKQQIRVAIADALDPLKLLRTLVATETARSISSLSGRMKVILDRIHFKERLLFEDAEVSRKSVQISASFDQGIQIDASTVANSSWLRAILWAFVLALREQAIEALGSNPFPLMILDDPQVTFDPRNKRKWAEELAKIGNFDPGTSNAAQLLIITHERQFFQMLVNSESLSGQQGLIVRPYDTSKVCAILYGTSLARAYQEATKTNDDAKGHAYVQEVRIYCEDLLKIMLRAEGPEVSDMTLDKLVAQMKVRRDGSVPPFTSPAFGKLLDTIGGGGGGKPMKLINEVHHKIDGTIGVAEAIDVNKFWEHKLQSQLHTCFKIYAEFEAYAGEPRLFPWMDNIVDLPIGNAEEVKKLHCLHTGVAAAAKTDGRVGDGLITIENLIEAKKITLYNHDIYQLAAGTLNPIIDIGDVIIVSNYAKVGARNLVVTAFEHQLLARRYNETDLHPHIAVLTGQSTDPYSLPQPVIAPIERISPRKIVGTLFTKSRLPIPRKNENIEFVSLPDLTVVTAMLQDTKLFKVSGRSAEPIALDGQFIMTQPVNLSSATIAQMDGRLVIAVDEDGARYLKRFNPQGDIIVLESLNPDGTSEPKLLSYQGEAKFAQLTNLLEVVGVLFDLPEVGNSS